MTKATQATGTVELTPAQRRAKFGRSGQPIKATRVFSRPMEHGDNAREGDLSVIAVNDKDNTYTPFNLYQGNVGKKWRPNVYPFQGQDSIKKWLKDDYTEGKLEDFDILTPA